MTDWFHSGILKLSKGLNAYLNDQSTYGRRTRFNTINNITEVTRSQIKGFYLFNYFINKHFANK